MNIKRMAVGGVLILMCSSIHAALYYITDANNCFTRIIKAKKGLNIGNLKNVVIKTTDKGQRMVLAHCDAQNKKCTQLGRFINKRDDGDYYYHITCKKNQSCTAKSVDPEGKAYKQTPVCSTE